MAKLNIMKNNKKPNMKGNRIKGYIANNEHKIKELEDKIKQEEQVLKKLLEQQVQQQTQDGDEE